MFFTKKNKLVETPLDDHSRSLYTALVHQHYSLAQLNSLIAKLSSFILKKQFKYFSLLSNIFDEIIQSLPKHNPQSTISEPTTDPPPTFLPPTASSYVLQTANPNVCINSSSWPTDNFVSEILTLLRPHVELAPNTDPCVILTHIFSYRTLQSLLQLHSTDIQNLTLSTIHVNDFLKKLILFDLKLILNLLQLNSSPFFLFQLSPLSLVLSRLYFFGSESFKNFQNIFDPNSPNFFSINPSQKFCKLLFHFYPSPKCPRLNFPI